MWPAMKDIPKGWRKVTRVGTKQECLEYIETVWTDLAPLSVRQRRAPGT